MKVFISWSGDKSRFVAVALRDWLPRVINRLDPFVSSRDIHAGSRWQSDIASQLDVSNFGIVCVTRDNQAAAWLNFEAGALAKAVEDSRVIPLAIDLKPSDVELPLAQFQAQPLTKDGIRAVVMSLNEALGEFGLPGEPLEDSLEVWWPRLNTKLSEIEQTSLTATSPVRTDRELLEETLETVRALARQLRPAVQLSNEERLAMMREQRRRIAEEMEQRDRAAEGSGISSEQPKTGHERDENEA